MYVYVYMCACVCVRVHTVSFCMYPDEGSHRKNRERDRLVLPFKLSFSPQFLQSFRTIFELKDFVETKSRETDYEALKGGCVKVRNEHILPSLFYVSSSCYHLVDFSLLFFSSKTLFLSPQYLVFKISF